MLGFDVFAILIKADKVDVIIGPVFKLASCKISTVSVSSALCQGSPYSVITFLGQCGYSGFGCVDLFLASFEILRFSCSFEYKSLGGLLNCGQNDFVDDSITSYILLKTTVQMYLGNWIVESSLS